MNLQRVGLLVALCTLLAAVYMLTYSGRIESGDTLSLFDATSSFVHYGDILFDQSASVNFPPARADDRLYPLAGADVEPLHSLLASGLFWLAERLPGVGLVHAAWLLNIFVSAAAAGTLFLYVLTLGYHRLTAVIAAFLFGLATMVWPYSKTFFREPLALWMILLAGLLLEGWRKSRYRSWPLFAASVLALVGAFLSKEAVVFALPSLALIVLPVLEQPPPWLKRLFVVAIVVTLLVFALLLLTAILASVVDFQPVYQTLARLLRRTPLIVELMHVASHTYLLSIGGSLWGTSPVVLLALPGMWWLYRRGQYRYILAALAAILAFAFGYAFLRGIHWFGGLSWPPRFLLPALPFLMLAALPALQRLTQRPVRGWMITGAAILILYSLWIQISAVSVPWGVYTAALPPEAYGVSEWGGGLNLLRYLRWVVIPSLWATTPLDFAWARVNNAAWPVLFGIIAVFSIWQIVVFLRHPERIRWARFRIVIMPLALVVAVYLGLRLISDDPLYMPSEKEALYQVIGTINEQVQPGDVLLLSNDTYQPFFLNNGKSPQLRVITLPDQPGEQPSPEQPAQVISENPDALLTKETIPLIYNLAAQREHLWLLVDSGPWLAWSTRPVERFLASHYYPLQVLEFAPTVRLIEYDITNAPNAFAFRGPDRAADTVFGGEIRLAGFDVPRGEIYKPGDILPVSLYWQAVEQPEHDYNVALFVANEDGSIAVQGVDMPPGGGFERTGQWQPGVPVWDNRALRLPADLPSGTYQLWVRLYYWDGEIHLLPVSGDRFDGVTGLLPVSIEIRS